MQGARADILTGAAVLVLLGYYAWTSLAEPVTPPSPEPALTTPQPAAATPPLTRAAR